MAENEQPAQQWAVQRIYIKDASFEAPMGAEVFSKQWKPQLNVELNTKSSKVAEDSHEVVLSITVTATPRGLLRSTTERRISTTEPSMLG